MDRIRLNRRGHACCADCAMVTFTMRKVYALIVIPNDAPGWEEFLRDKLSERFSYVEIAIEKDAIEESFVKSVDANNYPEPTGIATAEGMHREVSRLEREWRRRKSTRESEEAWRPGSGRSGVPPDALTLPTASGA